MPSTISLKPRMVSSSGTYLPGEPVKTCGDEERLREEALDLAGARDGELVVLGELVHAEDGDDVLEVLVALQDALHLAGDLRSAPRRRPCGSRMREVESSGSTAG